MASVRDTVLAMLTQYPSIFPDKSACYRHLFLVNGNGYEWVDGELVNVYPSKNEPDFKDEDKAVADQIEKFGQTPNYENVFGHEQYSYVRLDTRRHNMLIQFALDNIDLIMEAEHVKFDTTIFMTYSGWDYCKLMQMPDDVKPDWLEAVKEVRHSLIPCMYYAKKYGEYCTNNLKQMEADLERLKTEKFFHEYECEEEMKKMVEELRKENS